jgi:23S rRNA pseudouridine2604 synthase
LGTQVGDADEVRVDGRLLGLRKKQIYIALNKPAGITCTTETHVQGNIIDLVGHQERIFPIGRLDKESEGLILLTNDGDIVNEILRSENNHEKEYLVRVERAVTDLALKMMADGVKIMGEMTKPCKVSRVDEKTFRMILTQGLNRQIRRMCSALGYRVQHLRRVRIINIDLGTLAPGEWRELAEAEVAELLPRRRSASVGVPSSQEPTA